MKQKKWGIKYLPNLATIMFTICMVLNITPVYSQFYDEDDELRYYVYYDFETKGDHKGDIRSIDILAFNFNGNKAAMMGTVNTPGTWENSFAVSQLLEDPDLLVKRIYDNTKIKIIKYDSDRSTSSKKCYKLEIVVNNMYGFIDHYDYRYYYFSSDGGTLYAKNHHGEEYIFNRINLDKLLELISKREAQVAKRLRWR